MVSNSQIHLYAAHMVLVTVKTLVYAHLNTMETTVNILFVSLSVAAMLLLVLDMVAVAVQTIAVV